MNGGYNRDAHSQMAFHRLLYPVYEWWLQFGDFFERDTESLLYPVYEWRLQLKTYNSSISHCLLYPVCEWRLQFVPLFYKVCCAPFMNGGYNTSISQLSSRDFSKNVSNPIDF